MIRLRPGRALAAVLAAGLAGCAASPPPPPPPPAPAVAPGTPGGLGAYMAGRFAHAHGDTRTAADLLSVAAAADRDNTELQQIAFTLLMAEGRLDQAAPMARQLLLIDDDAPLPLLLLGTRAVMASDFAAAESRFGRLPHKGINSLLGPLLMAWTRMGRGDVDGALALLPEDGAAAPFSAVFSLHAAMIADLAGRPATAEARYRAALKGQPTLRAVEAAGAFLQRAGQTAAARTVYDRYHEDQPDRSLFDGDRRLKEGAMVARVVDSPAAGVAEALFDGASLARQSGANDVALVFARLALGLRPNFPLTQLLLADVLTRQGRLDEAAPVLLSIDPASGAADYARLRLAINLDEAGQTEQGLAELTRLTDQRPDNFDAPMTLGDILRSHKRYAEAADAYALAIRRAETVDAGRPNPRLWPLYYARGITLERSGRWPEAEADFLLALKLKPDQPDVMNYLGYSWVDQGVNLVEGRALLERAVRLRPNDGAIVDSLGWALYRLGDFAGAVRHLERAAELKPEDPTINDHLGDALWRVGRIDEARFQWRRALGLDPEPEMLGPLRAKVSSGELPPLPVKQ